MSGMEATGICLFDLTNLAIGTPEVGAVNFTALRTLLHAIIRHFHIQDISAELPGAGTGRYPPAGGKLVRGQERRILHMEALNNSTSALDLIERSRSGQQGGSSLEDVWQVMQLKRRLEAMTVLQDLMLEVNTLKESQHEVQDQIRKVTETAGLDAQTSITSQPSDNDISPMSEPIQGTDLSQPDEPLLDTSQTKRSQAKGPAVPVNTPHVTQDGMTASTLEDSQMEKSGLQHEGDLTHSHPGAPVPENTGINPSMTSMDCTPAPGPPGVNLAHPTGATSREQAMLYIRLDALERDKADRTELGLLQRNTDDLDLMLHDLEEKMINLNRQMHDLRGDRDKRRAMDTTETSHYGDQKLEETSQISQQLCNLRATIQDIENELKKLGKRHKQEKVTMEPSMNLQDQDAEWIGHIQKTMLQLQEECERLTRVTGSLIQDHEQKQLHIDEADRRSLESKVSRTHFDAATEHLNHMIQELLGKVSAQEQDWQRLLEKMNVEMQNKLDRMEIEPLKNILEQCWRDLRRQLQEYPPQYEADEAAGIRRQLMRRFHCISCDRTVDMVVPGSEILTIPNTPGLPAHRSNRPYTVFELDQVRQQSRTDRLPEFSDFGYMSSSRNCGGSHTLTFPQRRYARLQASRPCTVQKEDIVVGGLKEEVFILGHDGQAYRGRKDNHLPRIKSKDGKRSIIAHQKVCDCNLKGEENTFHYSSDIRYGISKAHMKSSQGSEQPLHPIKDRIPPTCF
ncbi:glutamine-rich protein 2 isoform X2 [Rhinoderma darwinii]|uniref:glutamine-rich protein 2 isoform X2 n=1 Tax=Rhinoderma darwinii TaxID=43563 RepID=UPI003F66C4EC